MPLTCCLAVAFLSIAPSAEAPAVPCPDVHPGLTALRAGRFEEAERSFARIATEAPEAPEGPFYQAFEMWWQLLDRSRERPALRLEMEAKLQEAALRAEKLRDTGPDRQRGLVYLGVARLLEAQSKAVRGAHMSASSSARHGHRALSEALERDPRHPEAQFAMGAYDYFADNLPAIVKGFRFLLMIPGGNRERGIARLEDSADHSTLFGTEALMLLSHIFNAPREQDHSRALLYLERAAAREPKSPLIALFHADLLFSMGRLSEAASRARFVEESLRGQDGYNADLARYASLRLAACALESHDPLGALRRIDDSLSASPPDTAQERRRWLSLLGSAAREAGRPDLFDAWLARLGPQSEETAAVRRRANSSQDDPVARPRAEALADLAAGRTAAGRSRLDDLIESHPLDPRLRYDRGRLLQDEGKLKEAGPDLEAAASGPPGDIAGWALLRLGWQKEREGRRAEALKDYAKAAGMKQFTFRSAARVRLRHAGEERPEA